MNEPNRLAVSIWGIKISAEGLAAVLGTIAIVTLLVLATSGRF